MKSYLEQGEENLGSDQPLADGVVRMAQMTNQPSSAQPSSAEAEDHLVLETKPANIEYADEPAAANLVGVSGQQRHNDRANLEIRLHRPGQASRPGLSSLAS